MRPTLPAALLLLACAACQAKTPEPARTSGDYLYVWAGDSAGTASDFLAVIDAAPASPTYGAVLATRPTGVAGTHPHHTEAQLASNDHLLANGYHAGRTYLYDLSAPRDPKILASFGDLAGFSHPHSFVRLANNHVLATFQYAADSLASAPMHAHGAAAMPTPADGRSMAKVVEHRTGGLVEMDERGTAIRSGSASDTTIADRRIFPYAVLPLPGIDRAVSTTTDMDEANTKATAEWVQLWRLSDLKLLRTVALPPGPRGDEQRFTGEPRLLPDGHSIYVHTFNCGLYLVRGLEGEQPTSTFVKGFPGKNCGVPILTGHYWLQTVPETHTLVALDIADAEHPREVSSVALGDDEQPHWIAIDGTGRRVVLNSGGGSASNRIFIVDFDPATGALKLDERFRDAGATRPGVRFTQRAWPQGATSTALPHGTVFSR